jgi:hypothetical protein
MGNGLVRPIDAEILRLIGKFVAKNSEALYDVEPSGIEVNNPDDFILKNGNTYYVFRVNIPMSASLDVALLGDYNANISFDLDKKIQSAVWLDNGENACVTAENGCVSIKTTPYLYGRSYYVRVCKLVCEE